MNCTKYLCKTGYRFFLTIVAISASFVTCCMSINTADFLCQWLVHVHGIILFCLFVFLIIIVLYGDFGSSIRIVPTKRFVYRAGDCVLNFEQTFVFFIGKNGLIEEGKKEILDYFDGLVLDYITKLSGVQSVIAECSLYICVHSILQEKK